MATALQTFPVWSVAAERRRARRVSLRMLGIWIGISVLVAATAYLGQDGKAALAMWALVAGGVATVFRPIVGIYIITFFSIAGDGSTVPSYPFNKNLSSHESLLYLGRGLSTSPLELFLLLTFAAWLIPHVVRRHTFIRGSLFWPMMTFSGFVVLGLIRGIGSGGNKNIALWESRAILSLPLLYILISNLFTRKEHYSMLFWTLSAAVVVDSFFALNFYARLPAASRGGLEALGDHPASLHAALLFVTIIAVFMFRRCSLARRVFLIPMAIPVTVVFFLAKRRSAFVGLAAAFLIIAVTLFWVRRRRFWQIVPIVTLIFAAYVGAFWNSQGGLGFPAQAIKTVVSPDQVSDRNQSSDLYRKLEAFDVLATIRSSRVLGLGFGKKFLRPVPLPDLSFWAFADYIPHSGILYIWIKLGAGGFIAMLYLFGRSMQEGARSLWRLASGDYAALMLASVCFVVMYGMFTFVDIGWDPQSMIVLGLSFAYIANADRLHGLPEPTPPLPYLTRHEPVLV